MSRMRVELVDPSGDVTPYDHALAAALAGAGAEVELVTSRFLYGPIPAERDYEVTEAFYRRATRLGLDARRWRRAAKLIEHPPDMLRLRGRLRGADVVHYQWLPLEPLDAFLLPPARPRVMTLHNVLRRGEGRRAAAVTRRLAERMDAVVVHTRSAARALSERMGVDAERVRVIPHGAFSYLLHQPEEVPLPPQLAEVEGPVVLCFGTIRPYKGVDVLLRAFRELEGAELWIVGRPLATPMEPLHALAREVPARVRFVTRYITDPEIPAFFRRADAVALPYRAVDQSGVLYAALAFGKPIVMSAIGGFKEVAQDHGAALLVPPEDPSALAAALKRLLADPAERERLAGAAAAAAAGPFSWSEIGQRTLALYEELRA
jgi:glycosyltransferase involved in cell wall biosynthesis